MKWLAVIFTLAFTSALTLSQTVQLTPGGQTALDRRGVRECDTPLIKAIHARDVQRAQEIAGSDVRLDEQVCGEGETALIESIATGMKQISADLIAAGANVNLADRKGVSPLMYAAWYCEEDVLSFLLKRDANVKAVDSDGSSALMYASYACENANVLAKLLKARADVNAKTKEGATALTLAASRGAECAVRLLVIAGADVNLQNKEGQTAITIARDKQVGRIPAHDRIYAFLSYFAR
jgi:ankyrin repeat protein